MITNDSIRYLASELKDAIIEVGNAQILEAREEAEREREYQAAEAEKQREWQEKENEKERLSQGNYLPSGYDSDK